MSRIYFGTDGIRGEFGGRLVNPAFFERLGVALRKYLREKATNRKRMIVVGRDSRKSGLELESGFIRGVSDSGIKIAKMGVVPTPAVSMYMRKKQADIGVVVTASHNPYTDNGIKFFSSGGYKIEDEVEERIEELIAVETKDDVSRGEPLIEEVNWLNEYREYAESLLPLNCLRGWKIVVDTAHGATVNSTPNVLRSYGAMVVTIGDAPNGENINAGVGSEYPEVLGERVRLEGANLGIAHDGDGDRVVFCDESGAVLKGDEILTILAIDALKKNKLPGKTLVTTIVSSLGLDKALEKAGARVERVAVGDRNVTEAMLGGGYTLGGEASGHFVLGDITSTGDGLMAALRIIEVLLENKKPLSQLRCGFELYPQVQCNLSVEEKIPLEEIPELKNCVDKIEDSMAGEGRILIRYSGTEPKIRLLVEATDVRTLNGAMESLKKVVIEHLEIKVS